MIEVVAAVSAASSAFNAIKAGFSAGRDIEGIYDQQERRRKILEWIAIFILVLVVGGFLLGIIYLWLNRGY